MIYNNINDSILTAQSFISSKTHLKAIDADSNILFLDKNENKLGCSPNVISSIRQSTLNNISNYPDDSCIQLKKKLAHHFALNHSNFLVTNGSIEALDIIFKTFKMNKIIVPNFTYWAYEAFAKIHNQDVFKIPLEDDFSIDIYKLIDKAKKEKESSIIFLCNPNNPTGKLVSYEEIAMLLESLRDSLIVIDEAYAEFARTSSTNLIKEYNNLIVIKSFSKAYGLAGLRIGYAVAAEEIIRFLSYSQIPFSVSSIAQIAADAALDDQEYLTYVVDYTEENRKMLQKELMKFQSIETIPSTANFILTKLEITKAVDLFNFLLNNKVVVRLFKQDTNLFNFIRISLGTEKDNQYLISLLSRFQHQLTNQGNTSSMKSEIS